MGPDCGTAYLSGFGLGFANVVPRGRIGCVAASSTGLQAVTSHVTALGKGNVLVLISQKGRFASRLQGAVTAGHGVDASVALGIDWLA